MNDIQRQDQKIFVREILRPVRVLAMLFFGILGGTVGYQLAFNGTIASAMGWALVGAAIPVSIVILLAHAESVRRRFMGKKYEALWAGCRDRLGRFEEVLRTMRRSKVADLREMPATIRRVGESLYLALRRADIICNEVQRTEQGVYTAPPVWQAPSQDAQAKELYRIADKNIAEYRMQLAEVMAGVHRAEAQSAVFMTTLDSLRIKMIGHRLMGRAPEMSSHDFLEALGEARLQLNAIDQALEELDFSQMPKMIAVIPPGLPDELRHLEQGNT